MEDIPLIPDPADPISYPTTDPTDPVTDPVTDPEAPAIPVPPVVVVVAENPAVSGRYTLDQYRALKAALASGAREVQYGDQRVAYQSPAQIRETLAAMEAELGFRQAKRRKTPSFSKGL